MFKDFSTEDLHGRELKTLPEQLFNQGYYEVLLPTKRKTVLVRGMTGEEENLFTKDEVKRQPLLPFFQLIAMCVQEKIDLKKPFEDPFFKQITIDEFLFILFIIRRLSLGDYFIFGCQCPQCQFNFEWEEDLASTQILYSPQATTDILNADKPYFNFKMPLSGHELSYFLFSAHSQLSLIDLTRMEKNRRKTESMRKCIYKFDGVEVVHASEFAKLNSFDLNQFSTELEKHSVGVNTRIEVDCPKCSNNFESKLPLESADFLLAPRKTRLREDNRLTTLWGLPENTKSQKQGKP